MGNFNRSGGSRGGYRGGFGGDRRSFDRQMFNVVCTNCGKDCQVPFRPTGDKPVYCSDCFERMGGRNDKKSFDRPRHDTQLESINAKLDKILSLLQANEIKPEKSKKSSTEKSAEETK